MSMMDHRKGRSRREICLKFKVNTSKNKSYKRKHHSKQKHVHSTPEKEFTEVLDILQFVNKKMQSLLLTLTDFTSCFRVSVAKFE